MINSARHLYLANKLLSVKFKPAHAHRQSHHCVGREKKKTSPYLVERAREKKMRDSKSSPFATEHKTGGTLASVCERHAEFE